MNLNWETVPACRPLHTETTRAHLASPKLLSDKEWVSALTAKSLTLHITVKRDKACYFDRGSFIYDVMDKGGTLLFIEVLKF